MQNEMIKVMDPGAAVTDAALLGEEGEIGLWSFATDDEEAAWLAQQISHWIACPVCQLAESASRQLDDKPVIRPSGSNHIREHYPT
jgi:hypothetical protein